MPATTRLALPYPAGTDPADVPADMEALADALDGVALDDQGLLAARPVSTPGSPGIRGRYWYATDTGVLYRDHGTGWTAVNPAHQIKDMIKVRRAVSKTITTSVATGIDFDTLAREAGSAFDWSVAVDSGSNVQILETGLYLMLGQTRWAAAAGGRRFTQITDGSGAVTYAGEEQPGSASVVTQQNVTAVEYLAAGATVSLTVFQDTGANQTLMSVGAYAPSLTLVKLGL